MRHAASLVLALTALVLLPTTSALSISLGADSDAGGTAAPTAPVSPSASAQDLPEVGSVVQDVPVQDLPTGELDLALPGVRAHADVAASASVEPGMKVGTGEEQTAWISPTSALSSVDPVVVAAVAAPLAVVAIGALGGFSLRAALGNVAGWTWRVLRVLLGLATFGLFSRIERGDLLENPVRARVHEAIAQEPGLTISDLQSRAGVAWGTTVHHLRRLESHGLVVSIAQGGHRRYFIANTPPAAQRLALASLMQPTAHRIATLVAVRPGIDQSALCETLGLNGPSASKHLGHFRGQGLVESQRVGRRTLHRPTQGLLAALGVVGHAPIASSGTRPLPAGGNAVLVAAR